MNPEIRILLLISSWRADGWLEVRATTCPQHKKVSFKAVNYKLVSAMKMWKGKIKKSSFQQCSICGKIGILGVFSFFFLVPEIYCTRTLMFHPTFHFTPVHFLAFNFTVVSFMVETLFDWQSDAIEWCDKQRLIERICVLFLGSLTLRSGQGRKLTLDRRLLIITIE